MDKKTCQNLNDRKESMKRPIQSDVTKKWRNMQMAYRDHCHYQLQNTESRSLSRCPVANQLNWKCSPSDPIYMVMENREPARILVYIHELVPSVFGDCV